MNSRLDSGPDKSPLEGRHYETGTLRNAWALRGATAPHTGQPYSEALLLGVSGGITFGYFTFAYGGELPHLALLTRNTFDPFETILQRLAPPREVRQTADTATAERQLNTALEAGETPVVWADVYGLPYYQMGPSAQMWMMRPMVVVGRAGEDYLVADGARRPWTVSAAALSAARGRVKKDRFRLMTLEPPNPERLAGAVQAGLRQCVSLFTEPPPKGARDNFGFAAYEKWAKMLVNTKHKQSWARLFPRGPALFQALGGSLRHPGLLGWVMTWTTAGDDSTAIIWDATTGNRLLTLSGHTDTVWDVAYSPDGRRLATASRDGTVKIWEASTGKELLTLSGHTGTVDAVTFSPNGKLVATGSKDGTAKIWDAVAGTNLLTLPVDWNGVGAVAFSPDGIRLAAKGGSVDVFVLPVADVIALAKTRVTRSLTTEECQQYLHMDACPAEH